MVIEKIKLSGSMNNNLRQQIPPVKPEKNIPTRPDQNPDPTIPKPGGNEPEKNDPTRIEEPNKVDPTRIDSPPPFQPIPNKKHILVSFGFYSEKPWEF